MKFSINKAEILKELNALQGVVEKKNTIPILSNILIEATDASTIAFLATDLDISLQTVCAADVATPGAVVVQAKKLFDIVRNLPDAEIHFLKEDNDWVKILCGSSEFKIVGQSKENFPSTTMAENYDTTLSASVMNNLIQRTIYAITQEESRYALNGAMFVTDVDKLEMVATDGHRLALASVAHEQNQVAEKKSFIIPKKALSEILKLTTGVEEPMEFATDENHLYFKIGARRFTSRKLAGQFPNYELVIPKNNDKAVPLNTERIAQAIKRAALMADERSHSVKFEFEKSKLNITSQSADVGELRETIPIDYTDASVFIGFNAQYLLDFFNVVSSDEVVIEFKDEQSPALIRPAKDEGCDYRYIVMPMRLM
ncbi:MAG: DNA polymerase III subunit beta [Acidobacteriota bacterium]